MSKIYKVILVNYKGEKTYQRNCKSYGEAAQTIWENSDFEHSAFVIAEENQEITHIYKLG